MYRPEYPRPSFVRKDWLNLNGSWDFEILDKAQSMLGKTLSKTIEVPFCPESVLSGIGETGFMNHIWYRRKVTLDSLAPHVLLHFGACDHECKVYVNGQLIGQHIGGYSSFSFDITAALIVGENAIDVEVHDDTTDLSIPSGKQCMETDSHGCYYTRTTGIWQTVWLEFLGENYIKEAVIDADVDKEQLHLQLSCCHGATAVVEVSFEGEAVATVEESFDKDIVTINIPVPQPQLWEPGSPKLYDIVLTIQDGEKIVDQVKTYCGFRKFEFVGTKLYLNGKPLFLRQVLDQGFYPEGIYTAETVEDIYKDIDLSMALGFNGARPHEKVFEEHYFYYADKVGYIVWGEYPNWGCRFTRDNPKGVANLLSEWEECVKRDRNHPSIMGWCPLNEAWYGSRMCCDAYSQKQLYHLTKALDLTRAVIGSSGGDLYISDIYDIHNYTDSPDFIRSILKEGFLQNPPEKCGDKDMLTIPELLKLPLFFSEYGGISYSNAEAGWGYHNAQSEDTFVEGYISRTQAIFDSDCIGYCYTQLTDVEQEQNGLYRYDRSCKLSPEAMERIRECNMQRKK